MIPSTVQAPLPLAFSVPSARCDSGSRYVVMFDGVRWSCTCEHYRRNGTDCRHILQKRLETKGKGLFDGAVYEPLVDEVRLTKQLLRVWNVMIRGEWLTLAEIAEETHAPPASVSAQLRHLRKARFGKHLVDKQPRDGSHGLWEYRLVVNDKVKVVLG